MAMDGKVNHNKPKLKVVFFSSAPIGIPFLESLYNSNDFEIIGVVTQPDQPSGRGMEIRQNIIKHRAYELGLHNIQTPKTLRLESKKYQGEGEQFTKRLENLHSDYFVVIAYGKIIPQHILDIPAIAPINIHGSLLPSYRGASPIQTALLNGDKISGITIMKMSAGLDEGDIISQLPISLNIQTTSKSLIEQFGLLGPSFQNKTLIDFSKNKISRPQDNTKATFTHKIEKDDGLIDICNDPLELVIRKYNAYYIRPKIYFIYKEKRVIIDELVITPSKLERFGICGVANIDMSLNPAIETILLKTEGKKTTKRSDRVNGLKN